jgi:hypothetical protein
MRQTKTNRTHRVLLGIAIMFLSCLPALLPVAAGQSAGNNGVYNSSGSVTGSTAYIDASAFASTSTDICATIYNILASNPNSVIDARGLSSANSNMICGSTTTTSTPWMQGTSTTSNASTILLPAGKISIYQGWVLPSRTRIIGEGNNPTPGGTIIQACKSSVGCSGAFTSGGTMLTMGSSSSSVCDDGGTAGQCSGVSIEGLLLEGNSQSVNGIVNEHAGQSSYVDHVNLHFIEGTALQVSGSQAQDSGPYANIAVSTGSSYATGTLCAQFDTSSTRGLHGLTCTAASGSGTGPSAAVTLDSNYNTIEDIHIEGFQDGILIGSASSAEGNTIASFNGAGGSGGMTNVVHVSPSNPVSDLSIFGIAGYAGSYPVTNTLKDEQSGTTLSVGTNPVVGVYVLGEQITGTEYYRLTNSPTSTPAWGFGSTTPGSATCALGSIYSNTGGSSGSTLYFCTYNGTNNVWTAKN